MQILIVEDDFISRNLLKKMLSEMGHEVLEAHDGQQGWEMARKHQCRFIITDWIMPAMDGLELCRRVRESNPDSYVYVIMLTAKDRKKDLVHVLHTGADDYIPKPFDPEELRARVLTGIRVLGLEERHRKLQSILIESRNKIRIVFDSILELIVAVDPHLNIVSANKAFVDVIHATPAEIVGRNLKDLAGYSEMLRNLMAELKPKIGEVFKDGQALNFMLKGLDDTELPTFFQVACLPVKDEQKRTFKVIAVMKDVTEGHRKTEEIHALNQRLLETSAQVEAKNTKLENTLKRLEETQTQMLQSEKMASIGQLAAGVAHEINNPTGFVSSNLKTLGDYQKDIRELLVCYRNIIQDAASRTDDNLGPAMKAKIDAVIKMEKDIDIDFLMEDMGELIGDCREGTDRIKKIVIDLKDFAHPGEDSAQTTDINKGLESTLNVVNNELKYKATVHRDFGEIPPVRGYPQQLNQVFMNILVNAAQAIEKKGDIHIRTRMVDDQVEIIIRDNGCGIPEEHLPKIYDPFFTTKDVGKGTGLGMNIVYNIIQKHNGTITVQSKVGEGTAFIIRLPVETEEAPALNAKTDAGSLNN